MKITLVCEIFFPPTSHIDNIEEEWRFMPASWFARRRVWWQNGRIDFSPGNGQWYLELWEQSFR